MSHTLFQAVKITPTPITKPLPLKPLLPPPHSSFFRPLPATQFNLRKDLAVKASSSVVDGGDSIGVLERCFSAAPACSSSSTVTYGPVMKGGKYGAFGGAATLEKSKLDMSQKQSKSAPEASTDGGNNNNDNINNLGGGSGGDDNGDDDSYFDNFDDGEDGDEGGLFRRRIILQELFDGKFIDTVLNEWQKTMMDLPAGLHQAVQMGLVSSAQIVNYLETNARPTATRIISRMLPQGLLRAFNGRIISDPAFLRRLLLEQTSTIVCSVWWELRNRKERIKQEWDLALINVLTVTACNAMVVWSLAPCRPYGNTFRSDLQNRLQKLPNNIFENSYRLREFDLLQRVYSFFFKAAELSMVGLTAGAVQGALSNLSASKKDGRLSVTIPTVSNNALGYGAFLGIYANLRYQLLCGFDKAMVNHFDVIGVALFFSTAMRLLNAQLGETSRLAWLGVESDPLARSENLLKAYRRPIEEVDQPSSSKWFMSKNSIISSGLELLGFKQGQNKTAPGAEVPPPPKARRKRVVRKKVATSRA